MPRARDRAGGRQDRRRPALHRGADAGGARNWDCWTAEQRPGRAAGAAAGARHPVDAAGFADGAARSARAGKARRAGRRAPSGASSATRCSRRSRRCLRSGCARDCRRWSEAGLVLRRTRARRRGLRLQARAGAGGRLSDACCAAGGASCTARSREVLEEQLPADGARRAGAGRAPLDRGGRRRARGRRLARRRASAPASARSIARRSDICARASSSCPQLADPAERRDSELALLLALGPALIMAEGGGHARGRPPLRARARAVRGHPEVGAALRRPLGLVARLDGSSRRPRARRRAARSSRRSWATRRCSLQAHHCQWATLYMLGAHDECCRHIEAGLALYDPERHRSHAVLYGGHDARVCALGERALACWLLGAAGRGARSTCIARSTWAETLAHVGSRVHAMDYALVLQKFRRDAAAVAAGRTSWSPSPPSSSCATIAPRACSSAAGRARMLGGRRRRASSEMRDAMASEQAAGTPRGLSALLRDARRGLRRARAAIEEGLRAVGDGFRAGRARRHRLLERRAAPPARANCCSPRADASPPQPPASEEALDRAPARRVRARSSCAPRPASRACAWRGRCEAADGASHLRAVYARASRRASTTLDLRGRARSSSRRCA